MQVNGALHDIEKSRVITTSHLIGLQICKEYHGNIHSLLSYFDYIAALLLLSDKKVFLLHLVLHLSVLQAVRPGD